MIKNATVSWCRIDKNAAMSCRMDMTVLDATVSWCRIDKNVPVSCCRMDTNDWDLLLCTSWVDVERIRNAIVSCCRKDKNVTLSGCRLDKNAIVSSGGMD